MLVVTINNNNNNNNQNQLKFQKNHFTENDIHIEFQNASVAYKQLVIFDDFNWKIPRGVNGEF